MPACLPVRSIRTASPVIRTALATVVLALCTFGVTAAESTAPVAPHSLSEFDFLIGSWHCLNSEAGKPDVHASVQFSWMYDGKVLKETVSLPGYSGQFMTTLDKRSNTFKGVAVDDAGGYVVWENPGMKDNKSSEVGYQFAHGQLVPVSRSDFERISATHYVIRDFGPDTKLGKGAATDTEDCTKDS